MLESIYQSVRVIAVYLLFSSVLLGILQESPYKPYVRLFTSLLLVLLMIRALSFLSHLSLDTDIERILEQAVNADDFLLQLEEAEKTGVNRIQAQILQELKKKVVMIVEEFGYEVLEVEINLDEDKEQNYKINTIELEIENIEENDIEAEQELKTALADCFSIEREDVMIKAALKVEGGAYGKMDRGSGQGDYFTHKGAVKRKAADKRK